MRSQHSSFFFVLSSLALFAAYRDDAPIQSSAKQTSVQRDSAAKGNPLSSPVARAEGLYRAGNFEGAVAGYQECIVSGSDAAAAYAGLARVYLKLQQVTKAQAAAERAVELESSLPVAHVALGEVYFRMGRILDAESEFLIPLRAHVPIARGYLGMSRVNNAAFDFRSGHAMLVRAHELDPEDPEIRLAWIDQLPRKERIASMKSYLSSPDRYLDRASVAHEKRFLAVLEDQEEHPERTCRLVSQPKSATLTLQPGDREGTGVPLVALDVSLNGRSSRLVLGTHLGNGIIVNNGVARRSNVQEIARTDIGGLGVQNRPEGYTGFVESVRIGKLEFRDCYITVAEDVSRESIFRDYDGYVNAAIFSQFLVDIDVPKAEMKLSELPSFPATVGEKAAHSEQFGTRFHDRYIAPEMSHWVPVFQVGQYLLIASSVNNSPPKLFRISLAVPRNYVAISTAQEVSTLGEKSSRSLYDSSGFLKDTWVTGPLKLRFPGLSYEGATAFAFDFTPDSNASGVEISGDLGLEVLRNLEFKIDYRDGLVDFGIDTKRLR